jgi:hypothetical protein
LLSSIQHRKSCAACSFAFHSFPSTFQKLAPGKAQEGVSSATRKNENIYQESTSKEEGEKRRTLRGEIFPSVGMASIFLLFLSTLFCFVNKILQMNI